MVSSRKPYFASSEICILAGGLCSRMGRNKADLRLGNRTLLSHIRRQAEGSGLPVRIIRSDLVPRCGPIGGIYTGLATSAAEGILFLSCDMPFISAGLLKRILSKLKPKTTAIFFETNEALCFPFWLRINTLSVVQGQLARKEFSLQALAASLYSDTIRASAVEQNQLFNINTPAEWDLARRRWRSRSSMGR
jgi:molybdenum cofactor guanylyltransferase